MSTKIKFDSSTRILSFVAGSSDEAAQLRAQIVGSIIEEANSRLLEIVTIELDGAEDTLRGWVPAPDQQESIFVLQSNGLEELRKYGLAKQLKSKLESGGSNYKVVNGEVVQVGPRVLRRALAFGVVGFALAWVLLVLRQAYREFMQHQS